MCAGDLLESSYVSSLINIQMEQLSLSFFLCPTRFECHQRGEGANEHNNEIQRHILREAFNKKKTEKSDIVQKGRVGWTPKPYFRKE